MAEFKNEFSWSKSRDQVFRECKRKYFFNHYGFWGGWDKSKSERIKKIYYLKQLATKEIWIGQVIHNIIEYVLKKYKEGEKISLSHAIAILEKRLSSQYIASRIKDYGPFPSKILKLFEHEYKINISEAEKEKLFDYARNCVINFYNSDIFMDIRKSNINDWILLEDFLKFDFEGNTIFLSIDFAMKKGENIILYDWKTGRERTADFDMQIMLYSLYVSQRFNIAPDKIIARVFNLSIDKVDDFKVDYEKLENAKKYMRDSISEMKKRLDSIPENLASEGKFEKEESYHCSRCNYEKVCKGEWAN